MTDDKQQVQPQVNVYNPPSIDVVSLLMSTRDLTIKTDTDLQAFKAQHTAAQAQIFSMFNEVKNDMNTVSASLDKKIDEKVGDVRDDIKQVNQKVGEMSRAQNRQTLILVGLFTAIAVASHLKFPEVLSIFAG